MSSAMGHDSPEVDLLVDRLTKRPKRALLRSERRAEAERAEVVGPAVPVKAVPSTLDHVMLTSYVYTDDDGYGGTGEFLGKTPTTDIEAAEVVSSRLVPGRWAPAGQPEMHAPVLRIRFARRVRLHEDERTRDTVLVIDKPMSGWRYGRLLKTLHRAGVVSTSRNRHLGGDRLDQARFNLVVPAALSTSTGQAREHGTEATYLYLDAPMTWRTYKRLMRALVAIDVVGSFWVKDAIRRGETRADVPWPIAADHRTYSL